MYFQNIFLTLYPRRQSWFQSYLDMVLVEWLKNLLSNKLFLKKATEIGRNSKRGQRSLLCSYYTKLVPLSVIRPLTLIENQIKTKRNFTGRGLSKGLKFILSSIVFNFMQSAVQSKLSYTFTTCYICIALDSVTGWFCSVMVISQY